MGVRVATSPLMLTSLTVPLPLSARYIRLLSERMPSGERSGRGTCTGTGALARPVWTLLPFDPDFRWLLGRDDSPWYPTMRLWRQATAGDWPELATRVAAGLADGIARKTLGG